MTVESSAHLNGFPVSVHNGLSWTSPISSSIGPRGAEGSVGLILPKVEVECHLQCTCSQPFTECKTEHFDWSDESCCKWRSFRLNDRVKSGSARSDIRPINNHLQDCASANAHSSCHSQPVGAYFRKTKRRVQNSVNKRHDRSQGNTPWVGKEAKMALFDSSPWRIVSQEEFLKQCGLVTSGRAIRLKQEIENHGDIDLECQIVAVEGPILVRPFLSPNSRSLMSHIKREVPEQSESKKQLHFRLDEGGSVTDDSEIDSEDELVQRRVTPSSLLAIDVSSPLGQRLKKHVKGDLAVQPITDVEHYCTFPPEHSNDVASRLRHRTNIPAEYRQRRRGVMSSYCHSYKFTNAERRQYLLTLRTGLSVHSRRLQTKMKRLSVCLKRLSEDDVRLLTMRRKSLINQEITIDEDLSIVQVDVPEQLFRRIQNLPGAENLRVSDSSIPATDASACSRSPTGIKRSIPKNLRPGPKSKRKHVMPESDEDVEFLVLSSEEEEQHTSKSQEQQKRKEPHAVAADGAVPEAATASSTSSAPTMQSSHAAVGGTAPSLTASPLCNCVSHNSVSVDSSSAGLVSDILNSAQAVSASLDQNMAVPHTATECSGPMTHNHYSHAAPVLTAVCQSQASLPSLSAAVTVSGAAVSSAAVPDTLLQSQSLGTPSSGAVDSASMLETLSGQNHTTPSDFDGSVQNALVGMQSMTDAQRSLVVQGASTMPVSSVTSGPAFAPSSSDGMNHAANMQGAPQLSSVQGIPQPASVQCAAVPVLQSPPNIQSPPVIPAVPGMMAVPVSTMQGIPNSQAVLNSQVLKAASPMLLVNAAGVQNTPMVLGSQSAPVIQYIPSVQGAPVVNSPPAVQGAFVLVGPVGGQSTPCMPVYPGVGPVLFNTPQPPVMQTSVIQNAMPTAVPPAQSVASSASIMQAVLPSVQNMDGVPNTVNVQTQSMPGQNSVPSPGQSSGPMQNSTGVQSTPLQSSALLPNTASIQTSALPAQNCGVENTSIQMGALPVQGNAMQNVTVVQATPGSVQNTANLQTAALPVQNGGDLLSSPSLQPIPHSAQNSASIQTETVPVNSTSHLQNCAGNQTSSIAEQNVSCVQNTQAIPCSEQSSTSLQSSADMQATFPLPGLVQSTMAAPNAFSAYNTDLAEKSVSTQAPLSTRQTSTSTLGNVGIQISHLQSISSMQNSLSTQTAGVLYSGTNTNAGVHSLPQSQNSTLQRDASILQTTSVSSTQCSSSALTTTSVVSAPHVLNSPIVQSTPSVQPLTQTASPQVPSIPGVPHSQNTPGLPATVNALSHNNYSVQNTSLRTASATQTGVGAVSISHSQSTAAVQTVPAVTTAVLWTTAQTQYPHAAQSSASLPSFQSQNILDPRTGQSATSSHKSQPAVSISTGETGQGITQSAASPPDPVEDEDSLRKRLSVFNLTPRRTPVSSATVQASKDSGGWTRQDTDSSPQLQIGAVYGAAELSNRQLAASLGLDNAPGPQSNIQANMNALPPDPRSVRPSLPPTNTQPRHPQQHLPDRLYFAQQSRGRPGRPYGYQRPAYPPPSRNSAVSPQWSGRGDMRYASHFPRGVGRARFPPPAALTGRGTWRSPNFHQQSPAMFGPVAPSGRGRAAVDADADDDCFEVICLDED